MGSRQRAELPASLVRVERRIATWRKTRTAGERIPEPLWRAAVQTATKYGLNRTAGVLKLDYYSLKKRMDQSSNAAASSTFIELSSSPLVASECVIEWEDAAGARMRVHVKGQNLPDVLALSRSFWNAD